MFIKSIIARAKNTKDKQSFAMAKCFLKKLFIPSDLMPAAQRINTKSKGKINITLYKSR